MATEVYVGTFQKPTTTAPPSFDQTISGVGFTPKVVFFFGSNQVTLQKGNNFTAMLGVADGSNEYCAATVDKDGGTGGVTDCHRYHTTDHCVQTINPAGVLADEATFKEFNSDGFVITWEDSSTFQFTFGFMAIGGDDIEDVAIVNFTMPTSTGTKAVTGVGFEPDAVFFITDRNGNGTTNPPDLDDNISSLSFGFAPNTTAAQQMALALCAEDGTSNTDTLFTGTNGTVNHCLQENAIKSGNPGEGGQADMDSFDSDGFTLDFTTGAGVASYVTAVCIKGGRWAGGQRAIPSSTGLDEVDIGFEPSGVWLLAGHNQGFGLGFASGASEEYSFGGIMRDGQSASNTTRSNREAHTDHCLFEANVTDPAGANRMEADLDSLDRDGFTLDFTTTLAGLGNYMWGAVGTRKSLVPRKPVQRVSHLLRR